MFLISIPTIGSTEEFARNVSMTTTRVKRAYRYRFYPTKEQAAELSRTFGCVRKVYNLALGARNHAWFTEQRRVDYVETSAMLTAWKKTEELSFLGEVSSVPLQQALRHLQGAFTAFFGKRAKCPRFKSRKKSKASAEYTKSGFRWRDGQLMLAKISEPLNIVWSRPLPEGTEPCTVTVSCDPAGRWLVSMLVDTVVDHLPANDNVVGIDAGIESLVTLSTGEKITNPQHERVTGAVLRRRNVCWPANKPAPLTGRRLVGRWPACMRGWSTGAGTICTR